MPLGKVSVERPSLDKQACKIRCHEFMHPRGSASKIKSVRHGESMLPPLWTVVALANDLKQMKAVRGFLQYPGSRGVLSMLFFFFCTPLVVVVVS